MILQNTVSMLRIYSLFLLVVIIKKKHSISSNNLAASNTISPRVSTCIVNGVDSPRFLQDGSHLHATNTMKSR